MCRYGLFWHHPNYKKLGHFWSWGYFIRVPIGNNYTNIILRNVGNLETYLDALSQN